MLASSPALVQIHLQRLVVVTFLFDSEFAGEISVGLVASRVALLRRLLIAGPFPVKTVFIEMRMTVFSKGCNALFLFVHDKHVALTFPPLSCIWRNKVADFELQMRIYLSRSACPLRWFGTGRLCF